MNWSITSYNSLFLRYVDGDGNTHLLRKAFVQFRRTAGSTESIEMIIDKALHFWYYLPTGTSPLYSTPSYGMLTYGFEYPIVVLLYYYEASSPIAYGAEDLLTKLNELLLSSSVKVQKNNTFVGEEESLNFIEGPNITITAVDDSANGRVNVTIGAAGLSEDPFPKILMMMGG